MWYTSKVTIQQSPAYYDQLDEQGNLFVDNGQPQNKKDTTEYTWVGLLGSNLTSIETHKPEVGDNRMILGKEFRPMSVEPIKGFLGLFTIGYKIHWINDGFKDYQELKAFYLDKVV